MIDLNAYFERIGYSGPHEPTLALLQAICALQPAAIAYENLDPFLGCAPDLSPPALQEKLVARGRGGYCFELNLLLHDVLLALGMRVLPLLARVVWMAPPEMPPRPRTHMLLKVEVADAPGRSFLADAGFGGQLLGAPLLFDPGLVQPSGVGTYRLVHEGALYAVEAQLPQGWMPMYRFNLDPQLRVDFEPPNWFTATHAQSIFRHNLLTQKLTPQGRSGLFNDRLVIQPPGGLPETRRIASLAEFERALEDEFALVLPVSARELFARIPKGQEGFVVSAGPERMRLDSIRHGHLVPGQLLLHHGDADQERQ